MIRSILNNLFCCLVGVVILAIAVVVEVVDDLRNDV